MLAALYLATAFAPLWSRDAIQNPEEKATGTELAERLIIGSLSQVAVVGGFLCVIAFLSNANARDLGLPASRQEFTRDGYVGTLACLVALAPVHLVQILLTNLLYQQEEPSGHPLVKVVMSIAPNTVVLLLAGVTAVVIAPICEEITFRLLLQGWLEKWEDERLGWRRNFRRINGERSTNGRGGRRWVE